MKITFFRLFLLSLYFFVNCLISGTDIRIPFELWPKVEEKISDVTILVAKTEQLSHQGFCGATSEQFQTTVIWFPDIKEETVFVNTNPGYGTVNQDLQVVFLNKNWLVLDIKTMEKHTGTAVAPRGTFSALEGIPDVIRKLGFKKNKPSPFRIQKIGNRYFGIKHQ
ncbi:MAG TPA: hypothetical protein PK165_00150 [bacterium]|nr:hypothetical protein [bacterium]HOL48940.1 hypothetical protein [bacterium]HPO51225.1 hypothetical protein [bacterium]HXK44861.1 hypothetical protein [bacterium]